MRRLPGLVVCCAVVAVTVVSSSAVAGGESADAGQSRADRIEELEQELDSLMEEVEDLQEPVEEFELFEECMYLIGVTEHGRRDGSRGYVFHRGATTRRRALAIDMRGFGAAEYRFLAFPAEEPPSIECNEDSGAEDADD